MEERINPLELGKIEVFIDGKKVTLDDIAKLKTKRFIPTDTREQIKKFLDQIDLEALQNADDETKYAYLLATTLRELVNGDDIGTKPNDDNMVNSIKYNGTNLNMQELVPTKKAKSGKAALLKLTKAAGLGSHIQVPLYHSGFWVTLRPLKDLEIVNLALDLSNELTRLSRSTLGTMHTLFNLPFIRTALDYLRNSIISTTIALDEEDDIFDYININDIYALLWGVAKSLYPKGLNVVIPCKNNNVVDPNTNLPKCTYKEHVHVDVERLLWIDRSKLTEDQIVHMAKRRPNSVTKEEVQEYVASLPTNEEINFTVIGEDETPIEITLHTPSINKFIDLGDYIVTELEEQFNDVIRKSNINFKDTEKIEAAKEKILATVYLKGYSHFIKQIKVEDAVLEDVSSIAEALEVINDSETMFKQVVDKLKDYLNRSLITTIGVPNFTCPNCGGKQSEDTIIPLAVYEYYFLLISSRYDVIMEKQTTAS